METIMSAPPHVYYEGYKTVSQMMYSINDTMGCPLCASKQPFAQCCKSVHLARQKKAVEKRESQVLYCENVIPLSVVTNCLQNEIPFPTSLHLSLFNFHTTTFHLRGADEMNELRRRLSSQDCRPEFHTTSPNFFNFVGYIICQNNKPCGIKMYGSLELYPASCKVELVTNSSQRNEVMLSEVQRVCHGLHPTDPVVTFSPVSGGVDKRGRKENLGKSVKGVGSFAGAPKVQVDKSHRLVKKCSYCALKADEKKGVKMRVCSACKQAYYCR
jgi:hypothetical protein